MKYKNIEILRETEKAVLVEVIFELVDLEKDLKKEIWIPKSLIEENGEVAHWFLYKKLVELKDRAGYRADASLLLNDQYVF